MDLSNSGRVCMQEFQDGLERIGCPWQELTGYKFFLDVFALFDQNKKGVIFLDELFPVEVRIAEERRLNTPDFWDQWCEWSDDYTDLSGYDRNPHWGQEGPPRQELVRIYKAKQKLKEYCDERTSMRSAFRRLKSKGKSDARVRECLASWLPRGTGPKDRQAVPTFSETEIRKCKTQYNDGYQNHVRSIQKEVYSMREQKQMLADTRQQLFTITGPLLAAARFEEEKKAAAASFAGFSLTGCKSGSVAKEEDNAVPQRPGTPGMQALLGTTFGSS